MYNILIADDEPSVCEGLNLIINWESYGFKIASIARNGKEALDKLKTGSYHLIITDIRMPVLDGLELIKALRAQNPLLKIIIISGYNDFTYAKRAIDYGVKGYLLKPIDRLELIQYITNIKIELGQEFENERLFQESLNIARNRFLNDLSYGTITQQEILVKATQYGIDMEGKFYNVALIEIDNFSDILEHSLLEANMIKAAVKKRVEDNPGFNRLGFVFEDLGDIVGILFCGDGFDAVVDRLTENLSQIRSLILDQLQISVTIGYGKTTQDITGIKNCREQAQQALERKLIVGENKIIAYEKENRSLNLINQIKKYIDDNYSENISLKSIARLFYVNPAYLGQLFKNATGETFKGYINKARISAAKKMVLSDDDKIYKIIEKVGYTSHEYFYRQFRKYEGIPFAEYKESLRKTAGNGK